MVNIYSPSVNAKIIRPDVSDRCVPGQRPKRRRVEIDKHTELIMRNQLKGRNCDFYKERTAIGISTGREGREKDTSSRRARLKSRARGCYLSIKRKGEKDRHADTHTDRQKERSQLASATKTQTRSSRFKLWSLCLSRFMNFYWLC